MKDQVLSIDQQKMLLKHLVVNLLIQLKSNGMSKYCKVQQQV